MLRLDEIKPRRNKCGRIYALMTYNQNCAVQPARFPPKIAVYLPICVIVRCLFNTNYLLVISPPAIVSLVLFGFIFSLFLSRNTPVSLVKKQPERSKTEQMKWAAKPFVFHWMRQENLFARFTQRYQWNDIQKMHSHVNLVCCYPFCVILYLLILWNFFDAMTVVVVAVLAGKTKTEPETQHPTERKKKHDAHYAITIHRLVHFIWNSFIKIHLVRAQEVCAWIIEYFFA